MNRPLGQSVKGLGNLHQSSRTPHGYRREIDSPRGGKVGDLPAMLLPYRSKTCAAYKPAVLVIPLNSVTPSDTIAPGGFLRFIASAMLPCASRILRKISSVGLIPDLGGSATCPLAMSSCWGQILSILEKEKFQVAVETLLPLLTSPIIFSKPSPVPAH